MKRILAILAAALMPVLALAQYTPNQGITGLFGLLGYWIKLALPIIISLAVVYFVWNVFQFAIKSDDEDAKKKAKEQMIWGIIGIFVMVSIWGLVGILQSTFGTSGASANIGSQLPI